MAELFGVLSHERVTVPLLKVVIICFSCGLKNQMELTLSCLSVVWVD